VDTLHYKLQPHCRR